MVFLAWSKQPWTMFNGSVFRVWLNSLVIWHLFCFPKQLQDLCCYATPKHLFQFGVVGGFPCQGLVKCGWVCMQARCKALRNFLVCPVCKYRLTVGCLCHISVEWHYFLNLRSNTLLWKIIECDPQCKRCYLILTLYKQPLFGSQVHPVETESNETDVYFGIFFLDPLKESWQYK